MSRRSELEKEIEMAQSCIKSAPDDTPQDIINAWTKELDSLAFELNNLYDDDEIQDS